MNDPSTISPASLPALTPEQELERINKLVSQYSLDKRPQPANTTINANGHIIYNPSTWTKESVAADLRQRALTGFMTGVDMLTGKHSRNVIEYVQYCTGVWTPDRLHLTFTRDDVYGYTKAYHLAVYNLDDMGRFLTVDLRKAKSWCFLFFPHQMPLVRERRRSDASKYDQRPQVHYYLEVPSWETEKGIVSVS